MFVPTKGWGIDVIRLKYMENNLMTYIMKTIAVISFYLSLVFGFGFGVTALFQIGRIGITQFAHWVSGIPPSSASNLDNLKFTIGSTGIPTSLSDILASMIGLGGLKSFIDTYSYIVNNLKETVSYIASIFGRVQSKIWVLIGIPAFVIDLVLNRAGYEHWPTWFINVGIQNKSQFIIVIAFSYVAAYVFGRIIGSPQSSFNKARTLYESVIAREGYWFDNRNVPNHYANHKHSLIKAEQIFDKLLQGHESANSDIDYQRLMTLYYQQALLLSTLMEFDKAGVAIEQCRKYKKMLSGPGIWEPQEESVFESQLLFLEGELAYIRGDKEKAEYKFNKSRKIDVSLHDRDGIAKNKERLNLISSLHE